MARGLWTVLVVAQRIMFPVLYCAVQSPEDFVKFSDSNIKGTSFKFMPLSEILGKTDIVSETPYLESMCTLKVHMIKSSKTKEGFIFNFSRLLRMKNYSIPTAIVDQEILLILMAISTFRLIKRSRRLVVVV